MAKNTLNQKQKYDWLFNDGEDETPRDTGISHRNLIKRVGDDRTTETNTGTKNDENLTDTIQSGRALNGGDISMIKSGGTNSKDPNLVTKSFQNMKNML